MSGNAFAIPEFNYMQFWATPFDITERGASDWVDNVFTHELAHIITHKAAHKGWPFRLGFVGINASDDNPDYYFTLPLYNTVMPSWYSEGMTAPRWDRSARDLRSIPRTSRWSR